MKIKGLKKAIGEYKNFNWRGGYCALMLNTENGEIWTDYFVSVNEWNEYHSKSIINLGRRMSDAWYAEHWGDRDSEFAVTMATVKAFIRTHFAGFENA